MEEDVLSEEEKKAIETLKDFFNEAIKYKTCIIIPYNTKSFNTILNLIEKQQKEIKNFKWKENEQKNLLKYKTDRIDKQQKEIQELKKELDKEKEKNKELEEYANWHIEHLTEDIADYIDDDRKANASLIGELKEEREHWKDIIRISNNEKTYIDYKNY